MNTTAQTTRPSKARETNNAKNAGDDATLADRITRFSDELRLKASLGRMELQDEINGLKPRLAELEREVDEFTKDVEGRAKLALKRARERFVELETKLKS